MAEQIGVNQDYVSELRRQVKGPLDLPDRVTGKDGKSYPAIVRAEMRMADEIDKGQQRGEVAGRGRPVKTSEVATFSDLGIRRDQVAEWRDTRDARP